ncbi:MAG: hypothetical protein AAF721_23830, partial [Myxococcota bacterium]
PEAMIRYALADATPRPAGVPEPQRDGEATPIRLVEAGLAGGHVVLYGDASSDEFALTCEHADFEATVAAGFDTQTNRLLGVCVSTFEGESCLAASWARKFSSRIARATETRAADTSDKAALH